MLALCRYGAGLPLNRLERLQRKRRNSLFYRTQHRASVGDMFTSLIHTAELHGQNRFDYLTQVQRHARAAADNPQDWLPWTYRANARSVGRRVVSAELRRAREIAAARVHARQRPAQQPAGVLLPRSSRVAIEPPCCMLTSQETQPRRWTGVLAVTAESDTNACVRRRTRFT